MRRSLVANKELKANSILSLEDLDVKRPGTGIPPNKINEIVGKKLKYDVEKDSVISYSDII